MPTTLTTRAVRNSTYVINIAPKDEDDTAVTPDSVTYTLTDRDGNVINSIEDTAIATPSTSMDVVLSGDDLGFQTSEAGMYTVTRYFTVTAQYDSDLEDNLPLIDTAIFTVVDPNALG
jgi:hypothetical protein